jgi:hypothetical protein
MSFKCKIGLHSWRGCKCSKCNKIRDTHHDWDGCKCATCGTTRDEQHDWNHNCTECSKCKKERTKLHTWEGCHCTLCDETNHSWIEWESCICSVCGEKQPHHWDEEIKKCINCGKISGISRNIINYEFLKIYCEYDWHPSLVESCSEKTAKILKEKYGVTLKKSEIRDYNLSKLIQDFNYLNKPDIFALSRGINHPDSIRKESVKLKEIRYFMIKIENAANTNINLFESLKNNTHANKVNYFEQKRPENNGLCSLDKCSCQGNESIIKRGEGYLYITKSSVAFRKDCLNYGDFQTKLQLIISKLPSNSNLFFTDVPVLVCEKGIKELGIDKEIAKDDAIFWWKTGLIPLRPSPNRK